LQALPELERHLFKVRLQQAQLRIRHGVQNAVALHVACFLVDHGTESRDLTAHYRCAWVTAHHGIVEALPNAQGAPTGSASM